MFALYIASQEYIKVPAEILSVIAILAAIFGFSMFVACIFSDAQAKKTRQLGLRLAHAYGANKRSAILDEAYITGDLKKVEKILTEWGF